MRVVTISNQKGGVAKTTTAFQMASGLSRLGYRVLVLDVDPQVSMSILCGVADLESGDEEYGPTLYDLLTGEPKQLKTKDCIRNVEGLFDIIPGSRLLAMADQKFVKPSREFMLKRKLSEINDEYDFVIIDTPPALGVLTFNSYVAADDMIIPAKAELLSLVGIRQLSEMVDEIKNDLNEKLTVRGILFTLYSTRTNLSNAMTETGEEMSKAIGAPVFNTKIRTTVKVGEAQAFQKDLFEYAPDSTAANDYKEFVNEYLEDIGYGKE